jgi:signal recognition particle protein
MFPSSTVRPQSCKALGSCASTRGSATSKPYSSSKGRNVYWIYQRIERSKISCQSLQKPSVVAATEEIVEVKDLKGIRMKARTQEEEENGVRPMVEYLVEWKDGSPDTWEPVTNLADNLLRDYEAKWWNAVKKADEATIMSMLDGGGAVLSRTLNEDRRSALHFAAALGKADLVRRLIREGAEVDLGDKEGYTPLHMAAGYLHTSTIYALIEGDADPEQQDLQGRSPLELVESLRAALPPGNPATAGRRLALEEVLKVLVDNLFEDVLPEAILDCREVETDEEKGSTGAKEYLVKFPDEEEPMWVPEKYVSEDVISDYLEGLEYAIAKEIIDVRNKGDSRSYLIRWEDGTETWEPEEHVSNPQDLVYMFENNGQLPPGVSMA